MKLTAVFFLGCFEMIEELLQFFFDEGLQLLATQSFG